MARGAGGDSRVQGGAAVAPDGAADDGNTEGGVVTREEQVLIRGKVFLYKQKAPFVQSGKSVLGALEYRESDDKVRCHECGEWHRSLAPHLKVKHSLTPHYYRFRHGLNKHSALCGTRFALDRSARAIAQAPDALEHLRDRMKGFHTQNKAKQRPEKLQRTTEFRNELGSCHAQVLERIKRLADRLGRTPTGRELASEGVSVKSALYVTGATTIGALMGLAGLLPLNGRHTKTSKRKGCSKYTQELLIELLRSYYVSHGDLPGRNSYKLGLLPPVTAFTRIFGSMRLAYSAAGLGIIAEQRDRERSLRNLGLANQPKATEGGVIAVSAGGLGPVLPNGARSEGVDPA